LLPIVKQTNLPLFVLQPKKSPWYWKLGKTIPALEKGGSDVFVKRIQGVRDRYYFRPDATNEEKQKTKKLPATLKQAARYLAALPYVQRDVAISKNTQRTVKTSKKERSLKVFQGNPIPPALKLISLNKKVIDLKSLKGQVVLVNFWASWCPPCVHEMPSMQRIQNRFSAKGFTILGVNMAEDEKTIRHFLKTKVNVQFPILFDHDGAALKSWGVFAFPTSYVVDKKGKIRFAIFGGVDWEQENIINKIKLLLNE
ncbi:MAG TPA: TlpA family protein disulfide reductase, partial [Oceanospirillales bacterium]|nr:TlpA family protein disulfide reductase [Oceanospirillales bacterium]